MEPDVLVAALGEYFERMSHEILAKQGTVDKYIGDAVMAFWGAPHVQDAHALLACRAALAMRDALREMQKRLSADGKPLIEARIGINTGVALVGNIGSPSRMNYTAMGDAVNLASRLEGLNKVYGTTIAVGETTALLVRGEMELRPLDFVAVKGKARAILVYELLGERGKVDERDLRAAESHAQALELYRARRFGEAAHIFEQVASALGPNDEASRLLLRRCRRYAKQPPEEDWDGSYVMAEK
jgi:adenylate cyclase